MTFSLEFSHRIKGCESITRLVVVLTAMKKHQEKNSVEQIGMVIEGIAGKEGGGGTSTIGSSNRSMCQQL